MNERHLHSTTTIQLHLATSRLPENTPRPCIRVLLEQNNPDICSGAAKGEVYSSVEQLRFKTLQLFVPNSKRLRGLHSMSPLFSFEKAHVTQNTSSRQTTSRPQDKKNPNTAKSELFSTRKPSICSGNLSMKNQEDFKERPSSSLCQTARGSGATSKWGYFFFKKVHTT